MKIYRFIIEPFWKWLTRTNVKPQPNFLQHIDVDTLNEKVRKSAEEGAFKEINDYYTSWNSPYRKKIQEKLEAVELRGNLELPDIIGIINDSLVKEIDAIANEAVAKTFVPLVKRFLIRAEAEVNFSEILKEFVESTCGEEYDDYSIDIAESKYDWLNINLSCTYEGKTKSCEIVLHKDRDAEKENIKRYRLLSLPYNKEGLSKNMKLSVDGITLEMPFTTDVLKDSFVSYIARLVIAKSRITMDIEDFDKSLFKKECHC